MSSAAHFQLTNKIEDKEGKGEANEDDASEERSLLNVIAGTAVAALASLSAEFTDSRKLDRNRQILISVGFFLGATYLFHFQKKQFDL